MEKAKVSIIVPVYNAEKYLPDCIKSLLNQTYQNIEVVLVDDGSKDRSLAICQKFSKTDSRLVVIHQENSGEAGARNRGLSESTGELIAFCDADDCYSPKFIESMVSFSHKTDMPICRASQWHSENECQMIIDVPLVVNGVFRPTCGIFPAWRCLYKRELIMQNDLRFTIGRKTGADQEFAYKYMLFCHSFAYVDDAEYRYRIVPTSAMHQKNYSHFDAIEALKDTVKYAEKYGTSEQARDYREDLLYHNAVRTLEFATVTVISGGEKPKKVLEYLQDKGYHDLILSAFKQPEHYDSRFYKLYLFSPIICLRLVSIKKKIGKVLRRLKIIN